MKTQQIFARFCRSFSAQAMKRGLEDATVEELSEMLIQARKKVRALEEVIARRAEVCQHQFVIIFPSGMRDNGEYYYECKLCGKRS